MFGAHIVMAEIVGLFHRILDDLLGTGRLRSFAHGHAVGTTMNELLDLKADISQINAEVFQHVGGHATAFLHQSQQNMLRAEVFVIEPHGLFIRSFITLRLRSVKRPKSWPKSILYFSTMS